jgi:ribosomal protein S27AE
MKNGKTIGIALVAGGVLIFLGGAAVSVASTGGNVGGAVLGVVLSLFIALPVTLGGIFLMVQGQVDAERQVDARRRRQILDMVKTRGQVDLSDLIIELNSSTEEIRADIYKLVGMGVFSGYVNWDKGQLYSVEASQLRAGSTCPNCGGELALGGKGVITCQNCGTDIFL